jgi:hypothetical protein
VEKGDFIENPSLARMSFGSPRIAMNKHPAPSSVAATTIEIVNLSQPASATLGLTIAQVRLPSNAVKARTLPRCALKTTGLE